MTSFKKMTGIGIVLLLVIGIVACGNAEKQGFNEEDSGTNESVGEVVDYTIVGTDPGSGLMEATEKAVEEYGLEDWEITYGSGASMTAALKRAYDKEEPIVFAAWSPHWKFIKFDIKFLDDPKLLYGDSEEIHTVGRMGLKDDLPEAYQIFQQFHWEVDDMAEIMVEIEDGVEPEVAANNWIDKNRDKVANWTEGVSKVDNEEIKLVYAPWDSEIASHNMMKLVLEDIGYKVTLTSVEPGPMFSAIADGSADASLAAWLPITHQTYVEKFEGKIDDIGVNMVNVKQGLAVPSYMDINSIEDLK